MPIAQLVQTAICYFRTRGVRHEGVTYRPLAVPLEGLRRLIDRYLVNKEEERKLAAKQADGPEDEVAPQVLGAGGMWFCLGSGSHFGAVASRWDAGKRLARTRCNVLLTIQTDSRSPGFPEHMSLKGGGDDVLYPVGTLFRVVRLSRTTSSELDAEACPRGSEKQWAVTVIELAATDCQQEAARILERKGLLPLKPDGLDGLSDMDDADATRVQSSLSPLSSMSPRRYHGM